MVLKLISSNSIETIIPPINYAQILPGIYRSGHPHKQNFKFMETLELKSIMYLSLDNYRNDTKEWAKEKGLNIFHYRIESVKEPFIEIEESIILDALENLLDSRNLPILIHDNKGRLLPSLLCALLRLLIRVNKGRLLPSLLCALLRLLNNWTFTSTIEEYRSFLPEEKVWSVGVSGKPEKARERVGDLEFIDRFPLEKVRINSTFKPSWLN